MEQKKWNLETGIVFNDKEQEHNYQFCCKMWISLDFLF